MPLYPHASYSGVSCTYFDPNTGHCAKGIVPTGGIHQCFPSLTYCRSWKASQEYYDAKFYNDCDAVEVSLEALTYLGIAPPLPEDN